MTDIRTDQVFEALRQPLALIENEDRRRALEAYLEAARPQLDRALFDLMSQLVQSIDEKTGGQYRIRLAYRQGGLGLELEERIQEGDETRWTALEGDVEKITIRLPAELKDMATEAASQAGTSANTWFVKALARALRNTETRSSQPTEWREERRYGRGSRLQGWVGGDDS